MIKKTCLWFFGLICLILLETKKLLGLFSFWGVSGCFWIFRMTVWGWFWCLFVLGMALGMVLGSFLKLDYGSWSFWGDGFGFWGWQLVILGWVLDVFRMVFGVWGSQLVGMVLGQFGMVFEKPAPEGRFFEAHKTFTKSLGMVPQGLKLKMSLREYAWWAGAGGLLLSGISAPLEIPSLKNM